MRNPLEEASGASFVDDIPTKAWPKPWGLSCCSSICVSGVLDSDSTLDDSGYIGQE